MATDEHLKEVRPDRAGAILIECTGCRWPIEGHGLGTLFCDSPKPVSLAYCAKHRALAYTPTPLWEFAL